MLRVLRHIDRLIRMAVLVASPLLAWMLLQVAWPAIDFRIDDESRSLLQRQPPVPDSENMFNAVVALYAPADIEDIAGYGAAAIGRINDFVASDAYEELYEKGVSGLVEFDIEAKFGLKELPKIENPPGLCRREGCLQLAQASPGEVEQVLSQHNVFLQRAKRLRQLRFNRYKVRERLTYPFFLGYSGIYANRILRSELALRFSRGEEVPATKELAALIAHGRLMLADADWFLGKITAASNLRSQLHLASDFIRETEEAEVVELLAGVLTPLTSTERDLCETLKEQYRQQANWHRAPGPSPFAGIWDEFHLRWQWALLSPSRSLAANARSLQKLCAWSALSAGEYLDALRSHRVSHRKLDYVLNPVGIALAEIGVAFDKLLPARLYDLDGFFRLVAVQAKLKKTRPERDSIAAVLTIMGPEHRDPYDGSPMRWDSYTAELMFEGRGKLYLYSGQPEIFRVRIF